MICFCVTDPGNNKQPVTVFLEHSSKKRGDPGCLLILYRELHVSGMCQRLFLNSTLGPKDMATGGCGGANNALVKEKYPERFQFSTHF